MKILNSKNILTVLALIGSLLSGNIALAQSGTENSANDQSMAMMIWVVIVVLLLVLTVAIFLLNTLKLMVRKEGMRQAELKGEKYITPPSIFASWYSGLTNAVPLEEEESIVMDHNYDGIRELDNHLPPWWTWMFYFSIVFAFVYWFL